MIAGTAKDVNMIEGEFKEISELEMVEAIKIGHAAIQEQCQFQLDLAAHIPTANPKREYCHEKHDLDLKAAVAKATYDKVYAVAKAGNPNKVFNDLGGMRKKMKLEIVMPSKESVMEWFS
jgi:polyribonucleotide nucleotidyltransferase